MKRTSLLSFFSVVLALVWLLLNDSLTAGHILLALIFAWLIPKLILPLRPLFARPHRLHLAIKLIWHVLLDIVRSNIAVGSIILGAARRQPNIEFIEIPLDMRNPHGLAMLAIIITGTPGTVWSGHDEARNILTLHILDLQDKEAWIRTVKERYEKPLMEIFE